MTSLLKELTTWNLRREAERGFLLGIAGEPGEADRARRAALGADPTPEQLAEAEPFLTILYPPFTEQDRLRLARCDLVASVKDGPGITGCRPADVVLLSRPEDLVHEALRQAPEFQVALARRLPGFREPVAQNLIGGFSRINTELAVLAGLPCALPWLAPYLPAIGIADWALLTRNQAFLVLRLAAAYGQPFGPAPRSRELAGVVGGSFGWRALARRAAGMLPGGAGLGVRATVAFTATYAVGRAAQYYYRSGQPPGEAEREGFLEEAREKAKSAVAEALERLMRQGKSKK